MSGTALTRGTPDRKHTSPVGRHRPAARHRGTAIVAAAMAAAAYAGTVGLLGGGLHFTSAIDARLPWHSLPLAGTGLLVAVALPMTVTAWVNWRGHRRAADAAIVAGAALLAWIAIEIALIRTYSWMQPVCAGYGVLIAALGWRARTGRHTG